LQFGEVTKMRWHRAAEVCGGEIEAPEVLETTDELRDRGAVEVVGAQVQPP
jgi:hypothetical protein